MVVECHAQNWFASDYVCTFLLPSYQAVGHDSPIHVNPGSVNDICGTQPCLTLSRIAAIPNYSGHTTDAYAWATHSLTKSVCF